MESFILFEDRPTTTCLLAGYKVPRPHFWYLGVPPPTPHGEVKCQWSKLLTEYFGIYKY
jgi:hypothetical protein